ncbi:MULTISPECIES: hypothetical protein [unclassified Streptomyces]|uniref:hypothetical protein n=1 Tax=unclassified Streptomyces TaxID=2593676 RepID=UPI00381243C8
MTPFQTRPRPAPIAPVHGTEADAVDTTGPQAGDDMTVEVALAVMAGARTEALRLCDEDGLCTGFVTLARLTAVRDSPSYTDRVRLRDILGDHGPFAPPADRTAAHATLHHRLPAPPSVVDGQGGAQGILVLAR